MNYGSTEILIVREAKTADGFSSDIFEVKYAVTVLHRGRDCTAKVGLGRRAERLPASAQETSACGIQICGAN
jgi:hypothetical protein